MSDALQEDECDTPSELDSSAIEGDSIQMRMRLPNLAATCDRFDVSDRVGASIATAVIDDLNLLQKNNSLVIDKNKIRRERIKLRSELQSEIDFAKINLSSIFFDGRKDNTLVMIKNGPKRKKTFLKEEHISLIQEPFSKYLGHLCVDSGSAQCIVNHFFTFFEKKHIQTNNLVAVGCDGTNVNTGCNNGIITLMEMRLKKPLQWLVCLLHINELPLRHLFSHLDGKTVSPNTYSGIIGKQLDKCETLPVVKFKSIESSCVFSYNLKDLSTDQQYLYDIFHAVRSGVCSTSLANRNPGPINHARWLTTANRILRLYVGTKNPSNNLNILTVFVMKVYAPAWFSIKRNHSCIHGAQNFFQILHSSRYLEKELLSIIDPILQRNAFFAHPENLLLSMIFDEKKDTRQEAFQHITSARNLNKSKLRKFMTPELNFLADDYVSIINWDKSEVTEPPIIASFSLDKLKEIVENGGSSISSEQIEIYNIPCHTQAVERCVKMVTSASSSIADVDNRDGYIRSKIEARKSMPSFVSKKYYNSTR